MEFGSTCPKSWWKSCFFLPASIQAGLRGVCKRWKELISSAEFRARSAAIAWNSGNCLSIFIGNQKPQFGISSPRTRYSQRLRLKKPTPGMRFNCKLQEFSLDNFPQDLQKLASIHGLELNWKWLAHGGLQVVLVEAESSLRVCTLDLATAAGANHSTLRSWRELSPLVLPGAPCLGLWEACLYDVTYDRRGQQRGWSFKLFVSSCRNQRSCAAGVEHNTSFYGYCSSSNKWCLTAPSLEKFCEIEGALPPVWLGDYVVGKGCVYARTILPQSDGDPFLTVVQLSRDGKHVRYLPPLGSLAGVGEDVYYWDPWSLLLDARSTPFCVLSNCSIFKCCGGDADAATTGLAPQQWVPVSRIPRQLETKMTGETKKGHLSTQHKSVNAAMAGDVIVIYVRVEDGVEQPYHILAYHIVKNLWAWVAQAPTLPWQFEKNVS